MTYIYNAELRSMEQIFEQLFQNNIVLTVHLVGI